MIFRNPRGGLELACDECGCRWFDRNGNRCYECGAEVTEAQIAEYRNALAEFHARKGIVVNAPPATGPEGAPPSAPARRRHC